METTTVDQILEAIGNLQPTERVRLVSQMAPEICRAVMDDPRAMIKMMAECRRVCRGREAPRRMEFSLEILRRIGGL